MSGTKARGGNGYNEHNERSRTMLVGVFCLGLHEPQTDADERLPGSVFSSQRVIYRYLLL